MPQSKPKVLVFPFDLLSHYSRCLQLAEAIREEYDVYFCHSGKYAALVKQAGFKTFTCDTFDAREVLDCARGFDFGWLNYENILSVLNSQIDIISKFKPIAVLGDTAPTLGMVSELTRTFYVNLMNGYMTRYYQNVRKIAKAHPAARYEDKLPSAIFDFMIKFGESVAFRQLHKPFKKIRKQLGLARKKNYLEELEGDLNLICDLPEFFPQQNLPANYKFIGPLYFSQDKYEPEILAFVNNQKPNILISMGSSGDLKKLKILNETRFSKYNIVVAGESKGVFTADHILTKPFINNITILDKIDLMICHGGNGTIYQALAFGVPLLCLTSIFEQEWNVRQVVNLGFCADLDAELNAEELENIIEKWRVKKNTLKFSSNKQKINVFETRDKFKSIWQEYLGKNRLIALV